MSKPVAPHGTRARYFHQGCRCELCRGANASYQRDRKQRGTPGLIEAENVAAHIKSLSRAGVGSRAAAAACDLDRRTLYSISSGRRKKIRATTAGRLLEVDKSALADHALVAASTTWRLIDELIDGGYTKQWIAQQLGYKRMLQIGRRQVAAINASRVERLYLRVMAGRVSR